MQQPHVNRAPGEQVALRGMFRERVWHAMATTVVADDPDQTVLVVSPGYEVRYPSSLLGASKKTTSARRWEEMRKGEWDLTPTTWERTHALWFLEPEKYYCIGMLWEADSGAFLHYYVNFQTPFQRSAPGFDALDLELDIVVDPDFSWRWKDVEGWECAKASHLLEPAVISSVESAADEVRHRVEGDRLGNLPHWLDWVPDSASPPAALPPGWQT